MSKTINYTNNNDKKNRNTNKNQMLNTKYSFYMNLIKNEQKINIRSQQNNLIHNYFYNKNSWILILHKLDHLSYQIQF